MAATGMHVGHKLHKKCRVLLTNLELLWGKRTFVGISAVRLQALDATESGTESTEQIVIPRKKVWSKEAVLETLASTVRRDPTAYPYQFQDDPYLSPNNSAEFNLYSLSQESGKSAAKYFINNYPKFFTKDFAEPHIPCLMPDTISLQLDEVSEAALKERISLRKVKDAVDMYDQLLQAGISVSMETTHDLLDLICLFCDKDPVQDDGIQTEYNEAMKSGIEVRKRGRFHQSSDFLKLVWRDQNNAERIFNMLPEKDTRCYSALIRGMVKHGAYTKAFSTYTDLLNNRLTADVHIFNALLSAAPEVREKYIEKWELITEILNQMSQQKVQPNLQTFNSILKALRRCGSLARTMVMQTLSEMKSLQIVPSLASFNHVLSVFNKPGMSVQITNNVLQEILSELAGKRLTCQDPDDVLFFFNAMRFCLDSKDLELAYEVQRLVEVGENWRLLGDPFQQNNYYSRFFNLLCMMEHIDKVLKWYRDFIPSLYYPKYEDMIILLQALDTDNRLDMLPTIWKDIRTFGQDNKLELIKELLALMARDKHSPEVQESFAACALDVKSVFVGNDNNRFSLEWSTPTLTHITSLLLRANKIQEAWEMMQLFKANNRVPSDKLFEDFLSVCRQDGSAHTAIKLVQLSAAFCLQATPSLAKRTLADFDLKEEQRIILSELETVAQPAD
ncbi:small ribosomal subunit protein mS39 [Nerophis ophidion]|uniref:small ribosomal subunit protein mS39 n=1 Tax=Nerophis ophidion TaxID=159077 RepID=UPI002AE0716E|nr:small ribosomal subunit protein mS39 [Nerophis ophidion]XP_061757498.1 small ribosomal subunit protein mS39 [Nerophis ophidion]XP_061757499.1 small ribosomal subunit protein mS39 [Nerophis ophidion]